jgi:hypothetical protein
MHLAYLNDDARSGAFLAFCAGGSNGSHAVRAAAIFGDCAPVPCPGSVMFPFASGSGKFVTPWARMHREKANALGCVAPLAEADADAEDEMCAT